MLMPYVRHTREEEQTMSKNSSQPGPSAPANQSSTPADIPEQARWHSGSRAPSVPTPSEVTALLEELDHPADDGGTIARIELESPDQALLDQARTELLAEDPIIGTSIGSTAGPDNPQLFDVFLEARCDLATVGQAFAKPDEIAGVTTARVDRILEADQSDATGQDTGAPGDHSQAIIDRRFAELRENVETASPETIEEELDQHGFDSEEEVDMETLLADEPECETSEQAAQAEDTTPVERAQQEDATAIGGDASGQQAAASRATTQQSDRSQETSGAAARGSPAAPDGADTIDDEPSGEAIEDRIAGIEQQLSALVARVDELDSDRRERDSDVTTRLEELETTVESLTEWQERLEAAFTGEYE